MTKVDVKQLQHDLKKMINMRSDVGRLRVKAYDVVRRFDNNNFGSFDRREVAKCLRSMGLPVNDSEMRGYTKHLFKKLDQDGNNSIGFNEFFEFFQNCLAYETDRKKFLLRVERRALSRQEISAAKAAFKAADKDNSNSIDVAEFGSIIKNMGMELTDEQLESIIQKEFDRRDKDKGGTLSFAEFEKLFKHCLVTEEKMATSKPSKSHDLDGSEHLGSTSQLFDKSLLMSETSFVSPAGLRVDVMNADDVLLGRAILQPKLTLKGVRQIYRRFLPLVPKDFSFLTLDAKPIKRSAEAETRALDTIYIDIEKGSSKMHIQTNEKKKNENVFKSPYVDR